MLPGSYIMAQNSSASTAALSLKYSKKGWDEPSPLRFLWKHNSHVPNLCSEELAKKPKEKEK